MDLRLLFREERQTLQRSNPVWSNFAKMLQFNSHLPAPSSLSALSSLHTLMPSDTQLDSLYTTLLLTVISSLMDLKTMKDLVKTTGRIVGTNIKMTTAMDRTLLKHKDPSLLTRLLLLKLNQQTKHLQKKSQKKNETNFILVKTNLTF